LKCLLLLVECRFSNDNPVFNLPPNIQSTLLLDKHKMLNQAININLWLAGYKNQQFHSLSLCYPYGQQNLQLFYDVLNKKRVQMSVCLLLSSGLDHVRIFTRRTTPNCNSNQYLAPCFTGAPRFWCLRQCRAGRTREFRTESSYSKCGIPFKLCRPFLRPHGDYCG